MKRVVFTLAAAKALRKLPDEVRAQVLSRLARYAEAGTGDVKAMQGGAGLRLRVDDYRVLFLAEDDQIAVRAVGHRRDIYR